MVHHSFLSCRRALSRASALGLVLLLVGGCGSQDQLNPSTDTPADGTLPGGSAAVPTDSTIIPTDSLFGDTVGVSGLTGSLPGIVFASVHLPTTLLNSVYTGTQIAGEVSPSNALTLLSATRAKGGRLFIKLCMGRDDFVKNADGTFSFTKWKSLVDRYRTVNLGPYITDGTIVGHFMIDEPQRAAKWGGKIIPQATLEAMAKYSKQIWPGMTTFVRVVPSWLASASLTYTYLDAGWLQYAAGKGDVAKLLAAEVAAAKSRGLGLAVGLNVLDGGNGSSGIRGTSSGKYAMSASEIRTYATVLLNESYSCAYNMWQYDATYYGRSDIKAAFADMSLKARAHAKTSCRQ
jgi:hypothetical protein